MSPKSLFMKNIGKAFGLYFLVAVGCFCVNNSHAQYVTLPDTNFVNWLDTSGYASCLNGNQLDTTCSAILTVGEIWPTRTAIRDLTGIQYFKALQLLHCGADSLTFLPTLPASLLWLDCGNNAITTISGLPNSMRELYCRYDQLTSIAAIPDSMIYLWCDGNWLTSLPPLPAKLAELVCLGNQLTSLPALPAAMLDLRCGSNPISVLPALPAGLGNLVCYENGLSALPALPPALTNLECELNGITVMPALPAALQSLSCYSNQLSALPALPAGLVSIDCGYNNLTSLPVLPGGLLSLVCAYNGLTWLPELPDSLASLGISYNANLTCLPQLKIVNSLNFTGTGITCLPNYGTVHASTPALNTVPLCGIYNPGGCTPYWDISGAAYYDANSNCRFDAGDVGTGYTKVMLSKGGVLQQQVFTGGEGYYSFAAPYDTYDITVDSSNLPFSLLCPASGSLTTTVSAADSFTYNNNFAFKCRSTGFDVGAYSMVNATVLTRPGMVINMRTVAGDMAQLYGAHCAAGVAGQVQITYSGSVTYMGPADGALTPVSTTNNTITWAIADFGNVNDFTAFNLLFQIDSNAVAHSMVYFTVSVTPLTGDNNPVNNTLHHGIEIVAPHDPNDKEVFPAGVIDTSQHWLTYTIRFQNTGSAPAINVRIADTLNENLDPSTFQLLAYSAKNLTQIFGNDVVFNFPNINLADSSTSDSASRGYVQYKVKLKDNLPWGTQISNTASVYFDFNSPVVTNTTTNFFGDSTTGMLVLCCGLPDVNLYPNPAHNYTTISVSDNMIGSTLQLTDAIGRTMLQQQITGNKFNLSTGGLSRGVYLVRIGEGTVKKLVVE